MPTRPYTQTVIDHFPPDAALSIHCALRLAATKYREDAEIARSCDQARLAEVFLNQAARADQLADRIEPDDHLARLSDPE